MTASKKTLLFVCTGNAGRSQMAEAICRNQLADRFDVLSAGVEPWENLHPMAVKLMAEKGWSMEAHFPKHINTHLEAKLDAIITIGDNAKEGCQTFRTEVPHIHWDISDPADADGTPESEAVFRDTLSQIENAFTALPGHLSTSN